ncbi:MAG: hypothetical protein JO115_17525 [Pseudonocardiales bacterium]|nr:hypothetical protein [Pseudonocardiales bacterium]
MYERSLQQLNRYFDQPLLNSYLLSAERIICEMEKSNRDSAYQRVLEQLLESSSRLSVGNGQVVEKKSMKGIPTRSVDWTGAANGEVLQDPLIK